MCCSRVPVTTLYLEATFRSWWINRQEPFKWSLVTSCYENGQQPTAWHMPPGHNTCSPLGIRSPGPYDQFGVEPVPAFSTDTVTNTFGNRRWPYAWSSWPITRSRYEETHERSNKESKPDTGSVTVAAALISTKLHTFS
jgi:hypothetical protein